MEDQEEKEQVMACAYNGILKLQSLLKLDCEKDGNLADLLKGLGESFAELEGHWDFYHRSYMMDEPLI